MGWVTEVMDGQDSQLKSKTRYAYMHINYRDIEYTDNNTATRNVFAWSYHNNPLGGLDQIESYF